MLSACIICHVPRQDRQASHHHFIAQLEARSEPRLPQNAHAILRRYSSKIIKAGALLPDTKLLLESWDVDAGVEENLARVQRENLFGKSSRSRVEDILRVFRQRYLTNPDLLRALVVLVRNRLPSESLDRILYFQATQSEIGRAHV